MKPSAFATVSTKKSVFALIVILPFLALIALLVAAGSNQGQASINTVATPVVDVMPITIVQQYTEYRAAVGQIEANQVAALSFDRVGRIMQTLVDEGQDVQEGQLVAVQDQQRIEANLQEIAATLARVEANARLAQLSEVRVSELVKQKLDSSQRLDEVRQSTIAANAQVTETKARQTSLEIELSKTRLYAPFAGTVITRQVDVGTVVNPGQAIYLLQKQGSLQARIALPADDAKNYQVGQAVKLRVAATEYAAKVKSIAPQRTTATRSVDMLFSFDDENAPVLAGDLVSLAQEQTINTQGSWVPRSALVSGVRGLWSVFVVEKTADKTSLVAKLVELNYADEQRADVNGALQAGDYIVARGVHKLVPGQEVNTQIVDSEQQQAVLEKRQ
jgi:RND family efflux transporter MFP subunit